MANPAQVITDYIRTYDGVSSDSDNEGDSAARRARLLLFLNHINSYIHYFREWEWTYAEATFSIASGDNSVPLANIFLETVGAEEIFIFLEFGREGSLWDTSRRISLREASRYRVMRDRQFSGAGSGAADSFTISGGKIQLPYTVTGDTEFLAYYRRRAQVLLDDDTELLLPDRYTQTVLMPGLCFRAQESKADARETWGSQFREGLSQMLSIENPNKTGVRRMPLAVRGGW